jgi:glycosyltransferase involved in cell wall biosynthesis
MAEVNMEHAPPIRVVHVIDGLSWGGSQRWVWDIVRLSNPQRFRHQVVSICPDSGDFVYADRLEAAGVYRNVLESKVLRLLRSAVASKLLRHRFVPVRKLLSLAWVVGCHISAMKRLFLIVWRFKPHVVHTHTFYSFGTGLFVKNLKRTPLIHSVPCLFSQMTDAGLAWMPKLYKRFHLKVDYFFTGASLEELRSVGVPERKTGTIQGVVDLDVIDATRREAESHRRLVRESLHVDSQAIIVLSVGRLHRSKGHLFALESVPYLLKWRSDIHWVLLGEGEQRSELEHRVKELEVERHVHLIGFHSDPLPFYAAADVYLRTTIFEAENLCSYQAMAMALPVVGFDTGCETELLRKVRHGLLVPKGDVLALAEATQTVLAQPDRGRQWGARGARFCREHLDLSQSIQAFCDSYVRLAGLSG